MIYKILRGIVFPFVMISIGTSLIAFCFQVDQKKLYWGVAFIFIGLKVFMEVKQ